MSHKEIRITPPKKISLGLDEIWDHRELLYTFAWRDIKIRYKNAALGILWVILQPIGLMLLLGWIFKNIWTIDTRPDDYNTYIFSGIILWSIFQSTTSRVSESLSQQSQILKKSYFPRYIIPASVLLVTIIEFIICLPVLAIIMASSDVRLSFSNILLLPISLFPISLFALGFAALFGALTVKFRDFVYIIPFVTQLMFFGSNIIYPKELISNDMLGGILAANPINASLDLFRYSIGISSIDINQVLIGSASSICWLMAGTIYFRKTETFFADLL